MRPSLIRLLGIPTVRAVRGATTVPCDAAGAIDAAVAELVAELALQNALTNDEIVSALFTVTPDLVAAFPARAARLAGWQEIPLLCATEIAVPGSLPRCIRVLLHVTRAWSRPPHHVYLREAGHLRPDLAGSAFRR